MGSQPQGGRNRVHACCSSAKRVSCVSALLPAARPAVRSREALAANVGSRSAHPHTQHSLGRDARSLSICLDSGRDLEAKSGRYRRLLLFATSQRGARLNARAPRAASTAARTSCFPANRAAAAPPTPAAAPDCTHHRTRGVSECGDRQGSDHAHAVHAYRQYELSCSGVMAEATQRAGTQQAHGGHGSGGSREAPITWRELCCLLRSDSSGLRPSWTRDFTRCVCDTINVQSAVCVRNKLFHVYQALCRAGCTTEAPPTKPTQAGRSTFLG